MRDCGACKEGAAGQTAACTYLKVRHLARSLARRYDAELACIGMKTTQHVLLSHVLRLQPARPGGLAREMGLDPPTLTRNVKPLHAAGWIELSAGVDGRSRTVSITAAGRSKHAEGLQRWQIVQDGTTDLLGAERNGDLHSLIDDRLDLLEPRCIDSGSRPGAHARTRSALRA
jgi:DNA-binding MarR family transcriptional regulator